MNKLLQIGEVAKLCGVTPKTIRYYQKFGLLGVAARSEGGYRLYDAADIVRLQQIRRLQSFGLSLKQIKDLLGEAKFPPEKNLQLRQVLETLLTETNTEIAQLEDRRARLEKLLAQTDLDSPLEMPASLQKAQAQLGTLMEQISPTILEQEAKFFAALDSYNWPAPYNSVPTKIIEIISSNPQLFQQVLQIEERFLALATAAEDSEEAAQIAQDLKNLSNFFPEMASFQAENNHPDENIQTLFLEVLKTTLSPAQIRFADEVSKLSEKEKNKKNKGSS